MFDKNHESEYLNYDDSYIFEKLKAVENGELKVRSLKQQKVSAAFLKELVRKVLYREPLKRVWEEQVLLKHGDAKPHDLIKYVDPTTIDFIITKSKIPKEWYITSKLENPITSMSPAKLMKDNENEDDFIEDKIRIRKPNGSIESLTREDSSLLKFLKMSELNIYGVYTKNEDFQKKILTAMNLYEKRRVKTE
jgi:hypothetical protein